MIRWVCCACGRILLEENDSRDERTIKGGSERCDMCMVEVKRESLDG